jgi:hypothetical protein
MSTTQPGATPLGELADLVRSKNAGPFWMTIDVFLPDETSYRRASDSSLTDPETIAQLFGASAGAVQVHRLPGLCAIKVSLPRPAVQGSPGDRDMHAGQQYVPLLSLLVP